MQGKQISLLALFFAVMTSYAGEVKIVKTEFIETGTGWTVHTTLRHDDTGWDHYADAWRVVTVDGKVLGTRTLYHPHVDEQPFTRSLSGVSIPPDVTVVYVEAHDKVHGWSKERVKVELTKAEGTGFQVKRH